MHERDRCENYRGIVLGYAAYKILSNIILVVAQSSSEIPEGLMNNPV